MLVKVQSAKARKDFVEDRGKAFYPFCLAYLVKQHELTNIGHRVNRLR